MRRKDKLKPAYVPTVGGFRAQVREGSRVIWESNLVSQWAQCTYCLMDGTCCAYAHAVACLRRYGRERQERIDLNIQTSCEAQEADLGEKLEKNA